MTIGERAVGTSRAPLEPRLCPACSMGIDDSALELCPLCFYDLDGPRPEASFDDRPLEPETSVAEALPARRVSVGGGPSSLDVLIAVVPLIVLIVVLAVALIER